MFDPTKPITPENTTAETPVAVPDAVPAPEPTRPEPVHFTPEQQKVFDEAIRKAMGKASSEARRELADAKARLAESEAQRARAEAAARPDATVDEKLALELDTERRKNAELTQTLRTRERESAIREAARNAHFIDEGDALRLIDIPDDATGEQISQAVNAFANDPKRFHLIKSTIKSGSGSGPSTGYPTAPVYQVEQLFGPRSDARLANRVSLTNPTVYRSLRAEAKKRGLVV